MKYEGMTTEQYKKVVEIAHAINKEVDAVVDEIIDWCECYDSLDEIIADYEEICKEEN